MKIEDIARLANVSKAAVSLALNGKPGIGPETRERIIQIAKDTGYYPRTKVDSTEPTTQTLRFLVFTNSGIVLKQYYQQPFFMELIHFIEERCRTRGYSLLFSAVDMEYFSRDIQAVLEEPRADGVILLGTNLTQEQIMQIAATQPNLVVLDTCYETLPVHFVVMNNMMGAYQAGSYLADLGHEKIGYVESQVRIHNFEARKRGFAEALKERGQQVDPRHYFFMDPAVLSSQETFKQQLAACRDNGSLPTALFCECDYMAISVIKSLQELGLRVPEDISVIGFDNINESVIVSPELTTIHVEKEKMAQIAVDLLVESIECPQSVKVKSIVDTQMIERLSCKRLCQAPLT